MIPSKVSVGFNRPKNDGKILYPSCGIIALSVVSGLDVNRIRTLVNGIRDEPDNNSVTTMYPSEIKIILTILGINSNFVVVQGAHPILRNWVKDHFNELAIALVPGHFVTHYKGDIIDTHIKFPVNVNFHWCKQKHVKSWIHIEF